MSYYFPTSIQQVPVFLRPKPRVVPKTRFQQFCQRIHQFFLQCIKRCKIWLVKPFILAKKHKLFVNMYRHCSYFQKKTGSYATDPNPVHTHFVNSCHSMVEATMDDLTDYYLIRDCKTKRLHDRFEEVLTQLPQRLTPFFGTIVHYSHMASKPFYDIVDSLIKGEDKSKVFFKGLIENISDMQSMKKECEAHLKKESRTVKDFSQYLTAIFELLEGVPNPTQNVNALNRSTLEFIFDKVIAFILEKKFVDIVSFLQQPHEDSFRPFIERQCKPHILAFIDKLADKIILKIEQCDFVQLFDGLIEKLLDNVELITQAKEVKKKAKEHIANISIAINSIPLSQREKKLQDTYADDLQFINEQGGNEHYIQRTKAQFLIDNPKTHEITKELFDIDLDLSSKDAKQEINTALEHYIHKFMIAYFPSTEGKLDLLKLVDEFNLMPEFNAIYKKMEEILVKTFSDNVSDAIKSKKSSIKNFFDKYVEPFLVKRLIQVVAKIVLKLIKPFFHYEDIKSLMAQSILPALNYGLIAAFINQRIYEYQKSVLPLLEKYLNETDQTARDKHKEKLLEYLVNCSQRNMFHLNLWHVGISKPQFKEMIEYVLKPIEEMVDLYKQNSGNSVITLKELRALIKQYYKAVDSPNPCPVIEKLFDKLVFELGIYKLPKVRKLYKSTFAKTTADIIANSFEGFRRSHHMLANTIADSLKGRSFAKFAPSSTVNIDKAFNAEVHKFAAIIHDLVCTQLPLPMLPLAYTGTFLTQSVSKTEEHAKKIFYDVLKNEKLNTNLVFNCLEVISTHLFN